MLRKLLLVCGILSPLLYLATDTLAGILYSGYSFTSQAVSELFAVGAPTSHFVVPLFTLSSGLLAGFAFGVWSSSRKNRALRVMAAMILGNAVNGLVLWNFFPMHMRGVQPTFTDTMHLILATDPFVLLTIGSGVAAFKDRLRFYSIGTIVILVVLAVFAFSYAPQVRANQPTAWLGLTERLAQYDYYLWQVVLAITLLRLRDT